MHNWVDKVTVVDCIELADVASVIEKTSSSSSVSAGQAAAVVGRACYHTLADAQKTGSTACTRSELGGHPGRDGTSTVRQSTLLRIAAGRID